MAEWQKGGALGTFGVKGADRTSKPTESRILAGTRLGEACVQNVIQGQADSLDTTPILPREQSKCSSSPVGAAVRPVYLIG